MNLLLDTHVFLWALDDDARLSDEARVLIADGSNLVFVSAATAWEITIKKALGKVKIPEGDYLNELRLHRFTPLDITTEHALAIEKLPRHHDDPFDRLLVAQSQVENLRLVTTDAQLKAYDVQIIAS